jgi:tetratricopeptide (TPR) repeat protein
MRSRRPFASVLAVVISVAISTVAQEPETLGDVARRLREEKAAQANSVQPPAQEGPQSDLAIAGDKSLLSSGPISQLQIFAWIAGGMAGADLVHEVKARGLSFESDEPFIRQLVVTDSGSYLAVELRSTPRHVDTLVFENPAAVAQMYEAAISVQKQDYRSALKQIGPMIKSNPGDLNLLFALANVLNKLEDFGHAAQVAKHVVELAPDFPYAHGQLSYAYYRMEDGPQAVAEARAMVRLRPESSDGHKFLGLGLSVVGDDTGALREYDQALKLNPRNAAVYYDVGVLRAAQNDFQNAVPAYEHAVALDPSKAYYFNNLGIALGREGKIDAAVAAFEKGEVLAPGDPDILQSHGALLCNYGRNDEAIEVFTALLESTPDWNMARPCLYRSLMRVGRTEEAQKVKEDYTKYSPNHESW